MTNEAVEKYRAPALEKGLEILELLASCGEGLTQGEIARALGRSPNENYRMLTTLVRRGYVLKSEQGDRYSLSLKMFALSQKHPPIGRLIECALPKMRAFAGRAWQSCHMALESNGDIVIAASAESPGNWSLALKPGSVVGLWNTGSGRVLAAFRSDSALDELISLHRPAVGEPPLNRPEFDSHIARVRKIGHERMPSETAVGVTNVAFPVLGTNGDAVAVINCPYIERVDDLEVPSLQDVISMISDLSAELTAIYGDTEPSLGEDA